MRIVLLLLYVLLLACLSPGVASASGTSNALASTQPANVQANTGVTHFVYLHPTDRPVRQDYATSVARSATFLKQWYTEQLDGRYTFIPAAPLVQVIALDHPASFYGTHNAAGDRELTFWNNVLAEARQKTGASFNDPGNAWLFFVDAGAGCNQISGAGMDGISIMSENDLRGLVGESFLDCRGLEKPDWSFTPMRWIGGQGHELGHAYGLPHPPGCDAGRPSCDSNALMWSGFYERFPERTYLLESEKAILRSSPYFKAVDPDAVFLAAPLFVPASNPSLMSLLGILLSGIGIIWLQRERSRT